MRIFIAVIVLIFSLQSWTKADDISEFEIEGMSVGDSLLDHVSKDKIQREKFFYEQAKSNKKFAHFEFLEVTNYDKVNVGFKDTDAKFIIKKISGYIWFNNDIKNCLKKKMKL